MTDREYLELAATTQPTKETGMDDSKLLELAGLAAGETYSQERNPLERDDLALRLAVKLGLTLVIESDMVFCRNQRSDKAFREQSNDPYAATRRAIVRSAAEIGRSMK